MGRMEPASLLELNIRVAISSVLDKRQWWLKWRDEKLKAKWLGEIRDGFLHETFKQTLVEWTQGQGIYDDVREVLLKFEARDASEECNSGAEEKRKGLEEWLCGVVTDFAFDDDEYEEYSDVESVEEERQEQVDGETKPPPAPVDLSSLTLEEQVLARNKELEEKLHNRESYACVKWTVSQLSVYEALIAIPLDDWTAGGVRAIADSSSIIKGDDKITSRAAALLQRLLRDGITVNNLKTTLPVPEDSRVITDKRLEELVWHCERIQREVKDVENYVSQWISLQIEQLGLHSRSVGENSVVITPLCIPGIYLSDNALSEDVMIRFAEGVRVLEDVSDEEKDWHPRSKQQVLDLVHPSLFCCVYGKTMCIEGLRARQYGSALEQMEATIFAATEFVAPPEFDGVESSFQWIPTEFQIDEKGRARALAYINNLHPRYHASLYECIESIVSSFVPLFEKMVGVAYDPPPEPVIDTPMYGHDCYRELPLRPKVPSVAKLPTVQSAVSLKSSTIKAIVKVAEIVLTPENPRYEGGSWHVEGTGTEKIVGTGLYYFGCENIAESRLAFRTEVDEPPYDQNDDAGVAAMFGLFNEGLLVQTLGSVTAMNGRCVVFPNFLQHQVQPFELADKSKPGVRKILALFLVDPKAGDQVLSTSDIPAQQRSWQGSVIAPVFKQLSMEDVAKDIVCEMLPRGMSYSEAKGHRLDLMDERAAREESDEADYERYFSLCEH